MSEKKTYRVVMEVTTVMADPAKWDWENVLELGGGESIRIVDSYEVVTKCEKCGYRLCGCGNAVQLWRVYTYDLWADGEGGKTVNDVYRTDVVLALDEDESESSVMTKLCEELGGDPKKLGYDHNSEGGDDTIYILDDEGNPACELRREKEEG
jgi:hypothetical protein